jgi:protein involved in polysaccharide export with SLBB domain
MPIQAARTIELAASFAACTEGARASRSRSRLVLVVTALLLAGTAYAQSTSGSILERLQQIQGREQTTPSETTVPAPSTPLEALVDPASYRLFSGDELHLGIWGETPRSFLLSVGPEGDLVLPGRGPLRIAGLTLNQAEEAVIAALRPSFGRARITLRLTQQAKLRIMVTGMVAKPGVYEMTGADRLSSLLELAGGVRPGGSLRRIVMRPSGDGGSDSSQPREIDMLPWLLRGDIEANPFLKPGVRIEVPTQGAAVRIRGPIFSRGALQTPVASAVRIGDRPEEEPDLFLEMRSGDTVGLLLDQVGGVSDRATGRGRLLRENEPARLLDLSSPDDRALPLRPGDTLEVEYAMRWIFVTGAVRSPGRFPYLPGLDARSYIHLAGGPTEVGRTSGWSIEGPDGTRRSVDHAGLVLPGSTLRVPERRSYKTSTWLSPLSTATAVVISIVALTRR